MSDRPGASGLLADPPAWLFAALIATRVLVVTLVILDAGRHPVQDPVVLRAERVATSPARPYLAFPVGGMPLETTLARVVGGGGVGSTAGRIAVLAFAADLAAAAAMFWGWGRRPAATYLVIGLPLLSFIYLRFDLVSVALAAWGVALLRRHGDDPVAGGAFALAVWAKLWPIVLLPLLWIVRARRAALVVVGVVIAGGAAWYLTGGPKGPIQVLTQRGAVGWSVESTVGNLLTLLTGSPAAASGNVVRVGTATTAMKAILFLLLLACEAAVWWRATSDDRDASGGTALVAVVVTLVLSPILSLQYLAWLLPWTAFAFEGDLRDRRAATLATVAIVITGLLGLRGPLAVPGLLVELAILLRNALLLVAVAGWVAGARARRGRGGRVVVAQS